MDLARKRLLGAIAPVVSNCCRNWRKNAIWFFNAESMVLHDPNCNVGQASSLSLVADNSIFLKCNDRQEACPTNENCERGDLNPHAV